MRTEQELLLDCLRRLNASKIPYMVTGSMASNVWGQLQDCAGIVLVQANALDLPYLRERAWQLGVSDTLERILSGEISSKTT